MPNPVLLQQAVNASLEDDSYYERLATPLKSAQQLKAEHAEYLTEHYKFKEFTEKAQEGFAVIFERLPRQLPKEDWQQTHQELKNLSSQHRGEFLRARFKQWIEHSQAEQPANLQEIFQISYTTMLNIYDLGTILLNEKQFDAAEGVFTVLAFLNPTVPEYLIGTGIAHYWQQKYEESLKCFELAKILQPQKAVSWIYAAMCQLHLNDHQNLQNIILQIQKIFKQSPDQQMQWNDLFSILMDQTKLGRT